MLKIIKKKTHFQALHNGQTYSSCPEMPHKHKIVLEYYIRDSESPNLDSYIHSLVSNTVELPDNWSLETTADEAFALMKTEFPELYSITISSEDLETEVTITE